MCKTSNLDAIDPIRAHSRVPIANSTPASDHSFTFWALPRLSIFGHTTWHPFRRSYHSSTMLNGTSFWFAHKLQNAFLLLLSLAFLPLDTFLLTVSFFFRAILQTKPTLQRKHFRNINGFRPRRILVTGVGMTKGLTLARLFYEAGHDVIGADFEPKGALVCGRVSCSLTKFYRLTKPDSKQGSARYIQDLLDIVARDKIDLWVSCSGVVSAVDDGEAKEIVEHRTACKAVQFDMKTTQMLHEKDSFISHTARIGMTVPETHTIIGHTDVHNVLRGAPRDRKYILKPIGIDDSSRADMTLLPRPTTQQTTVHVLSLQISKTRPWILQQYIRGSEYCTHALVIRGEVKAFVACPSAELLMHYAALPPDSALNRAMLAFTKTFASHGGTDFTGHLSFDFLVEGDQATNEGQIILYPIECNPRAHTAVVLFNDDAHSMVKAYLSLLDTTSLKTFFEPVATPTSHVSYYWIGHDVVELVLLPLISVLTLQLSVKDFIANLATLAVHILFWRDGTYTLWDPLPWWWLYHVYWPMQFWNSIWRGKKWSRINVSTTKMFEC